MTVGDGGHIWPARITDPRIQALAPGAATQYDVSKALEDLGYTGTIDDMWKQYKVANGILSTAEPFELTIASGGGSPTPSELVLVATLTGDRATGNGLDDIVSTMGGSWPGVDNVGFSDDGLNVVISCGNNNQYSTYSLAIAFDLTVATKIGGDLISTAPAHPQFRQEGLSFTGWRFGDWCDLRVLSVAYTMETPGSIGSSINQADFGTDTGADGGIWISKDGLHAVAGFDGGSPTKIRLWHANLGTAFDLTSDDTATEQDIETMSGMTTIDAQGGVHMDDTGTKFYAMRGTIVYMFRLSTAWDPTSASYDVADRLTTQAGAVGFHVGRDGRIYAFNKSTVPASQRCWVYAPQVSYSDLSLNQTHTTATVDAGSIFWSDDGTQMVLGQFPGWRMRLYTCSTPFDMSTVGSVTEYYPGDASQYQQMFYGPTGLVLYMADVGTNRIASYDVANNDIANIHLTSDTGLIGLAGPASLQFNGDGTEVFIGVTNGDIKRYTLSTPYDLNTEGTVDYSDPLDTHVEKLNSFVFMNEGKTLWGIPTGEKLLRQWTLATAYDTRTSTYDGALTLTGDGATEPGGMWVDEYRKELFIVYRADANLVESYTW